MYHQSGRLVHDQHIIIFIHNLYRYILRLNGEITRLVVQKYLNHIQRFDFMIAANGFAVDEDIARIGGVLNTVTGSTCHVFSQILVNSNGRLSLIYFTSKSFPEFVFRFYVSLVDH